MNPMFSITSVIKKSLPSIVSISVSQFVRKNEPPLMQNFLFFPREEKKKVKVGGGSGFIADKSGIIITNRHVIKAKNAEYNIVFNNQKQYKGKIIDIDELNDIAFLKIEGRNFPTLKLGDSSRLKLGETVIAIGNTLGIFRNTVSVGVISGLSREITAISQSLGQANLRLRGLIQTDAAINPGNSGGPLINLKGEVIGINVATVLGAENVGFAFPVNTAKKDLQDIKKYGRIKQPFLGIRYLLINKDLQKKFNLPVEKGALIVPEFGKKGVLPNSPGDKGGLKEGDIILKIGKKEISENCGPSEIFQSFQIGKEVLFNILRNGGERKVKVVLSERK